MVRGALWKLKHPGTVDRWQTLWLASKNRHVWLELTSSTCMPCDVGVDDDKAYESCLADFFAIADVTEVRHCIPHSAPFSLIERQLTNLLNCSTASLILLC